jgi:hypothetical protein
MIKKRTIHNPPLPLAMIRAKMGLGDIVATAAAPIAVASDALLGSDLRNCRGCAARREGLNALLPNVNPFAQHDNTPSSTSNRH